MDPTYTTGDLQDLINTYNDYKSASELKNGHILCLWLDNDQIFPYTFSELQTLADNSAQKGDFTPSYLKESLCVLCAKYATFTPEESWSKIKLFLSQPFFKIYSTRQKTNVDPTHETTQVKRESNSSMPDLPEGIRQPYVIVERLKDFKYLTDDSRELSSESLAIQKDLLTQNSNSLVLSTDEESMSSIEDVDESVEEVLESEDLAKINGHLEAKLGKYDKELKRYQSLQLRATNQKVKRLQMTLDKQRILIKKLHKQKQTLEVYCKKENEPSELYRKQSSKIKYLKQRCNEKLREINEVKMKITEQPSVIAKLQQEVADTTREYDIAVQHLEEIKEGIDPC
ncbi:uncharacterized protein LOC131958223 isoform X2 [Physella acuta]|nr:uncharacterized protein LOC131958223 isoform X2 [Physella acuta]XP_059179113.1 uncharacterized protein LOC131958223 isoform X2 [Physella acuta]